MTLTAIRYLAVLAFAAIPLVSAVTAEKKPLTAAENYQIAKANPDPETRIVAIQKLSDLNETDERSLAVSEMLVEIVTGAQDPFVGKAAVKSLSKLQKNVSKRPKTKFIKPFIKVLADKNALPGVRSEVAQCFAETLDKDELNDRDAFAALKAIAKDRAEQNIALRGKCIEAVGSFADEDAIVMLCELLSDPDAFVKEAAARAISILLDKAPVAGQKVSLAAVNKIVDMVNDDKLGVDLRVVVIRADAQMMAAGTPGANKGMETIIKLVSTSPEDRVVLASIEALGIVGTAQAAEPLIKTYKDFYAANGVTNEKDVVVRRAVAKALRAVLSSQSIRANPDLQTVHKVAELLVSIVDNDKEVSSVKESTIFALGYLYSKKFDAEHKEPVLALIFLLDKRDTDPAVKAMIPDVLEALTRVNFGQDVERWKSWAQKMWPGTNFGANSAPPAPVK